MLFLINVKNRGTIGNYNSATIDYKENSASVLTFTILQNSPFFNNLNKYIDKIEVINFNEEIIFTGRVLDVQKSMNDEGEFINTVTCESVLNYLVDVTVPVWNLYGGDIPKKAPVGSEGNVTVNQLLNKVLDEYNSGAKVSISLGNVTVEGNVTLKTNRQTCLEVIMDGLINVFGGFIQIREENNIYYLDYLEEAPLLDSMTAFEIGVNIQNISIQDKLNNFCTRLIAIGKTQAIQAIAINEELVKIYGVIDKVVQFKNITNIEEVQEKANSEIEDINNCVLNANIGALDLSYINNDFNNLALYQSVEVNCGELNYNKNHYIVSITLNLLQPFASTFSLNTNKATQIDQITQLIQQNNATNREMTEIHGTLEEKTSNVEFTAYQEKIEKELSNTVANENILEFEEAIQRELNGKISNNEFEEYKEGIETELSNKTSNLTFGLYQESITKDLSTKASIADVMTYRKNIEAEIATKVSEDNFEKNKTEIETEIADKISNEDFNIYKVEVKNQLNTKASINEMESYKESMESEITTKVSENEFKEYKNELEMQLNNKISDTEFELYQKNIQQDLNEKATSVELEVVREEALDNSKNKSIVYGGFITELKSGEIERIILPNIFKTLNEKYQFIYSIASIQAINGAGISSADIVEVSSDKSNGIFNLKAEIVSAELGETKNVGTMSIMWLAIG